MARLGGSGCQTLADLGSCLASLTRLRFNYEQSWSMTAQR